LQGAGPGPGWRLRLVRARGQPLAIEGQPTGKQFGPGTVGRPVGQRKGCTGRFARRNRKGIKRGNIGPGAGRKDQAQPRRRRLSQIVPDRVDRQSPRPPGLKLSECLAFLFALSRVPSGKFSQEWTQLSATACRRFKRHRWPNLRRAQPPAQRLTATPFAARSSVQEWPPAFARQG